MELLAYKSEGMNDVSSCEKKSPIAGVYAALQRLVDEKQRLEMKYS
jgi:hypothetical protein